EVNEEGTEAAAATAVVTKKEAAKPQEPPRPRVFRADHPFLFLIRDRRTDGILFVGRVTDPRAWGQGARGGRPPPLFSLPPRGGGGTRVTPAPAAGTAASAARAGSRAPAPAARPR